jgi:hypothetical protein
MVYKKQEQYSNWEFIASFNSAKPDEMVSSKDPQANGSRVGSSQHNKAG